MTNKRSFYLCKKCGNLVGLMHDGGGELTCCGEAMLELKPNTTDAAQEKHVPAATREGGSLRVNVGTADHPMLEEHYIGWIAVAQGARTTRVALNPGEKPYAEFVVGDGPATVYAWCNLHGLWMAEA